MWKKWLIRWKKCQLTVENCRWTEKEERNWETDFNQRPELKVYVKMRLPAVKKKIFPGSAAKLLQEHELLWRTVALVLWYTQKRMPHSAINQPILSKITDSVNIRIINLNMSISFSTVKELSSTCSSKTVSVGLKGPLVLECLQLHICQKGLNLWGEK